MAISTLPPVQNLPAQPTPLVPASSSSMATGAGSAFGDILDAINPLQHIPVVSNLYRAATGSHISTASQVAGDTLYGALLPGGAVAGLASSLANVAVKQVTGKDIGQIVVSAVTPSSSASSATSPTPLVPNSSTVPPTSNTQAISVPASVSINHGTQASNASYERALALDSLNGQLLKMAV